MDQRDAICGRLGDLVASVAPETDRLPDAREWGHISQRLDRRARSRSPRRLVLAVALCLALVAGGGWLVARRPLGYRVQGCTPAKDGIACPTAGIVAFSDGTRVSLDPGARLRIQPLAFGRGAKLSLDDGDATLAVVHRIRSHWAVLAGPFRVEVTGTRFSVHWSNSRQVLDVVVHEGEVHVSGGALSHGTALRAGQSLHAEARPSAKATPKVHIDAPPPSTTEPAADAASRAPAARSLAGARPPATRSWTATRSSRRQPEAQPDSTASSAVPIASAKDSRPPKPKAAMPATASPSGPPRPPARQVTLGPPGDKASWIPGDSLGMSPPKTALTPKLVADRVVLGKNGQLAGGMTGNTWLDSGNGTALSSPATREKHVRLLPGDDGLCASGTVAGLRCVNEKTPRARCNWYSNWGVAISLDVRSDGDAWGDSAARGIAVEFHGRSSRYRLNAHKAGDPRQKTYCIEDYKSGHMVRPSMFKSRCWDDSGDTLPDFKSVDVFNLQFLSGTEYVGFHYCISNIRIER